jgi:ABC-type branched-subunit amino acid transport system substrate-binding protein
VISRYVVRDRKAKDVVFVGAGPEAPVAMEALRSALQYWGGRLAAGFTDESRDPRSGQSMAFRRAARADWVVVFGSPLESSEIVNAIEEEAGIDRASHPSAPPGITASSALLVSNPALARPEPGTSACYPYTWAGWAEAIRRVARFRAAFQRYFGRPPGGLEQEGYDAVRTLASALERDRVRGGAALTSSLERVKSLTLSGFPIDLGPDDHLFLPRDELGLFAVAGPRERLDPWQSPGSEPWRPLMRTFTYDGRRDNILDQDKRVFFPRWRKDRPGPFYWRSRYGIVSRPGRDPLH